MSNVAIVKNTIDNAPVFTETPEAAVARLAALPPLEYERKREAEAKRLVIRVSVLDEAVASVRTTANEAVGKSQLFPIVKPWTEPVNGAALLTEIVDTIERFIKCSPETANAAALWIAFTWLVDQAEIAPLAIITAPEMRCGKSQLLSLIGKLCRKPLVASNISAAAVFRVIEAHSPTLLIDEADSFLRDNEELRGVINSGHTRQTAYVIRTVGDDHEPKQFGTWGAKVLCGIGTQASTLMDRAIVLELRRKLPTEKVERLRHAPKSLFPRLASMLARFADDAGKAIGELRPALPEALNDRAQDNWEPLLAIADYVGGDWSDVARKTAIKLCGVEHDAQSISTELLADIHDVLMHFDSARISSRELIDALVKDDDAPWATYNRGKPLSPRQLSKRLGEYGLKPKNFKSSHGVFKGYAVKDFVDVFARYIPIPAVTPDLSATPLPEAESPLLSMGCAVADNPLPSGCINLSATLKAAENLESSGVADKNTPSWGETL